VVDERVHPLVADPQPLLRAAALAVTGDRMARTAETNKALALDVQQIARAGPLIEAGLLTRLPGRPRDPSPSQRPPDGRVRTAGLAANQPRPPTRAPPDATDPLLLRRRQKPRLPMRPRRPILK